MLRLILKVLTVLILLLMGACVLPKIYDLANQVRIENRATAAITDIRFEGFDQVKTMRILSPGSHKQYFYWMPKRSSLLTLSYRLEGKDYTQAVGEAKQGMGWGRWTVYIEQDGHVTIDKKGK